MVGNSESVTYMYVARIFFFEWGHYRPCYFVEGGVHKFIFVPFCTLSLKAQFFVGASVGHVSQPPPPPNLTRYCTPTVN